MARLTPLRLVWVMRAREPTTSTSVAAQAGGAGTTMGRGLRGEKHEG